MKLADKLGKRVIEAARTIQSLLKTMNPNIDADARQQMANAIEGLAATLEEAAGLLGLFGQKGFFKKVLSGNLDARRFAELDRQITRSLELMGQAVGRMTLDLANLAYEAIVAVDAKLGRVEDLMKLQQQLGVSAAAFQEEMGASLEEMKGRQSETLAEVLKGNRMLQEVHSALTVRLSPPMNSACLSLPQPACLGYFSRTLQSPEPRLCFHVHIFVCLLAGRAAHLPLPRRGLAAKFVWARDDRSWRDRSLAERGRVYYARERALAT
jgi:hypothetical protein